MSRLRSMWSWIRKNDILTAGVILTASITFLLHLEASTIAQEQDVKEAKIEMDKIKKDVSAAQQSVLDTLGRIESRQGQMDQKIDGLNEKVFDLRLDVGRVCDKVKGQCRRN